MNRFDRTVQTSGWHRAQRALSAPNVVFTHARKLMSGLMISPASGWSQKHPVKKARQRTYDKSLPRKCTSSPKHAVEAFQQAPVRHLTVEQQGVCAVSVISAVCGSRVRKPQRTGILLFLLQAEQRLSIPARQRCESATRRIAACKLTDAVSDKSSAFASHRLRRILLSVATYGVAVMKSGFLFDSSSNRDRTAGSRRWRRNPNPNATAANTVRET